MWQKEITVDAKKCEPDASDLHSIQEAEPDSLAGCERETYHNLLQYSCIELKVSDVSKD